MRASRLLTLAAWIALAPLDAFGAGKHGVVYARAGAAKGSCEVDRTSVEVNQVVDYSISVASYGDDPPARLPSPGKLDGFEALSSASSVHQMIGSGGQSTTVTLTYHLRARELGTHVLGPGKMYVEGNAVSTGTCVVTVVPAGTLPPPPKKKKHAPDPFFDDPFFGQEEEEPPPPQIVAPVDPAAAVDRPPSDPEDRFVFVRAVADTRTPVIGQQVTIKVFVYVRRKPRITIKRPPSFPDFAMIDLGQLDHEWHPMTIAGDAWAYANIAAYAIFPLKTGSLSIGPAEVESTNTDYFGNPGGGEQDHRSNDLSLEVLEPPNDGRPAGYALGDVAEDLLLGADVVPREGVVGHALVTLRLRGNGRLDSLRPTLPSLPALTWTTTGDDARATPDGTSVRGVRKLTYDVAFDRAGAFDLGDTTVSVWDPEKRKYVTARASLGKVRVERAVEGAATSTPSPLSQLPAPRLEPGAEGGGSTLADRTWLWGAVIGAPFAVVLLQGASRLVARARKRSKDAHDRPESQAELALRDARTAEKQGDRATAAAAMTKAIDRALEASTGVRARSLTSAELAEALTKTSLDAELAQRIASVLSRLSAARFADAESPRVAEAAAIVEQLRRGTTPEKTERA